MVGLNESCVIIGSHKPVPIQKFQVQVLELRAADILEEKIELVCKQLYELAKPLCTKASEMSLPPLQEINHEIPLIDLNWIYPWRPSRCPEVLRPQWIEKWHIYLNSGHWKVTITTVLFCSTDLALFL